MGNVKEKISCLEGRNITVESRKVLIFKSKKQICGDLQSVEKSELLATKTIFYVSQINKHIEKITWNVIKINNKTYKNDLCATSYQDYGYELQFWINYGDTKKELEVGSDKLLECVKMQKIFFFIAIFDRILSLYQP